MRRLKSPLPATYAPVRLYEDWTSPNLYRALKAESCGEFVSTASSKLILFEVWTGRFYYKCSEEELRRFCIDRKIQLPNFKDSVRQHRAIAKKLIDADTKQKFERFASLPPELQDIIYEDYLSQFNVIDSGDYQQPALAQVSSDIRKYVMPMYYGRLHLILSFKAFPVGEADFRLSNMCVHSLSPEWVRRIRKISFTFFRGSTGWALPHYITIVFDPLEGRFRVTEVRDKYKLLCPDFDAICHSKVTAAFTRALTETEASGGGQTGFCAGDLEMIGRALAG